MKPTTKQQIIGAWRLVSFEHHSADGQITHPLSLNPQGMLLYTDEGFMSVQIMDPNRDRTINEPGEYVSYEDLSNLAYTGHYHIEENSNAMIHLAEISLNPDWVGTKIMRTIQLDGDVLRLGSVDTPDSVQERFCLLWRRLSNPD